MKTVSNNPHHKQHKITITAMVIGILMVAAGLARQFYLDVEFFHPLEGYALLAPGVAIILRSLHPPMGFIRMVTSLLGGACIGACPMFYDSSSDTPPWICIGLILLGAALLGGSFTNRTKVVHHHKHA